LGRAALSMLGYAADKIIRQLVAPSHLRIGGIERSQHRVFRTVTARGKKTLHRERYHSLDHHAAAHLHGRRHADFVAHSRGIHPQERETRGKVGSAASAEQHRYFQALRRYSAITAAST